MSLCRSRRELSNEYLLAKFGFDTAENEPYYFDISSSREFEVELRNFEPLICNPEQVWLHQSPQAAAQPCWLSQSLLKRAYVSSIHLPMRALESRLFFQRPATSYPPSSSNESLLFSVLQHLGIMRRLHRQIIVAFLFEACSADEQEPRRHSGKMAHQLVFLFLSVLVTTAIGFTQPRTDALRSLMVCLATYPPPLTRQRSSCVRTPILNEAARFAAAK